MKKNVNLCVDLKTFMQTDTILKRGKSYFGKLARKGKGTYHFKEIHIDRHGHRNPILYAGAFLSMVQRADGTYRFNFRDLPDLRETPPEEYAMCIYCEILNAFETIGLE